MFFLTRLSLKSSRVEKSEFNFALSRNNGVRMFPIEGESSDRMEEARIRIIPLFFTSLQQTAISRLTQPTQLKVLSRNKEERRGHKH